MMTYPDDLCCQDCGQHHFIDTSIPSEIWNQIAQPGDLLCTLCIDKRLCAANLQCDTAEFYFCGKNLKSRLYGDTSNYTDMVEKQLTTLEAAVRECKSVMRQGCPATYEDGYVLLRDRVPIALLNRLQALFALVTDQSTEN